MPRKFPLATRVRTLGLGARVLVAVALAIFVCLQLEMRLATSVLVGPDEGFEVAKATLVLDRYKLYEDVWDDQPPLHTYLLSKILRFVPGTMLGPRLLTSAFGLILLVSVFLLGARISGRSVGALMSFLVLASPAFLQLASSCMLEIPALAVTLAALAVLASEKRGQGPLAEAIAGVLLGIAFEIKLISIVLLPIAALLLWQRHQDDGRRARKTASSVFLVCAVLAATMVAVDLVVCHGNYLLHFRQSWVSHFGGQRSLGHGSPGEHRFDWAALARNWDLTLPAILGVVICLRRGLASFLAAIPALWLAYNLAVFGLHQPWWNYYYVHTAIPLCWCAAIGIEAAWKKARETRRMAWFAVLGLYTVCSGGWWVDRLYTEVQLVRQSPQTYTCLFLTEMKRYKPLARWLYAEEPVWAFHSGIPLPPDLAVVVAKRFWSGEFTDARLVKDLQSYKPELILLKKDSNPRPFQKLLDAEYAPIYSDGENLLYVLKSIARLPSQ